MNFFFFTKNPNQKKQKLFFPGRGKGDGGARVSDFFFTKNLNNKKKTFFRGGGGGGGGGGG